MLPIPIAISGRPKAGKNSLADDLYELVSGKCADMSYAETLRDVAQAVFGCRYETHEEKEQVDPFWDPILRNTPQWGPQPVTGRRILQYIGTDLFRNHCHKDIWILAVERKYRKLDGFNFVTLSDCRYPNEAEWARSHGGIVIHMTNPNLPPPEGDESHECENGLPANLIDVRVTCYSVGAISSAAKLIVGGFRGIDRYHGPSHLVLRS